MCLSKKMVKNWRGSMNSSALRVRMMLNVPSCGAGHHYMEHVLPGIWDICKWIGRSYTRTPSPTWKMFFMWGLVRFVFYHCTIMIIVRLFAILGVWCAKRFIVAKLLWDLNSSESIHQSHSWIIDDCLRNPVWLIRSESVLCRTNGILRFYRPSIDE